MADFKMILALLSFLLQCCAAISQVCSADGQCDDIFSESNDLMMLQKRSRTKSRADVNNFKEYFEVVGTGCCSGKREETGGKLWAGTTQDLELCQAQCLEFEDCGVIEYGWQRNKHWCFIWSKKQSCSSLDQGADKCGVGGSAGVKAYKFAQNADLQEAVEQTAATEAKKEAEEAQDRAISMRNAAQAAFKAAQAAAVAASEANQKAAQAQKIVAIDQADKLAKEKAEAKERLKAAEKAAWEKASDATTAAERAAKFAVDQQEAAENAAHMLKKAEKLEKKFKEAGAVALEATEESEKARDIAVAAKEKAAEKRVQAEEAEKDKEEAELELHILQKRAKKAAAEKRAAAGIFMRKNADEEKSDDKKAAKASAASSETDSKKAAREETDEKKAAKDEADDKKAAKEESIHEKASLPTNEKLDEKKAAKKESNDTKLAAAKESVDKKHITEEVDGKKVAKQESQPLEDKKVASQEADVWPADVKKADVWPDDVKKAVEKEADVQPADVKKAAKEEPAHEKAVKEHIDDKPLVKQESSVKTPAKEADGKTAGKQDSKPREDMKVASRESEAKKAVEKEAHVKKAVKEESGGKAVKEHIDDKPAAKEQTDDKKVAKTVSNDKSSDVETVWPESSDVETVWPESSDVETVWPQSVDTKNATGEADGNNAAKKEESEEKKAAQEVSAGKVAKVVNENSAKTESSNQTTVKQKSDDKEATSVESVGKQVVKEGSDNQTVQKAVKAEVGNHTADKQQSDDVNTTKEESVAKKVALPPTAPGNGTKGSRLPQADIAKEESDDNKTAKTESTNKTTVKQQSDDTISTNVKSVEEQVVNKGADNLWDQYDASIWDTTKVGTVAKTAETVVKEESSNTDVKQQPEAASNFQELGTKPSMNVSVQTTADFQIVGAGCCSGDRDTNNHKLWAGKAPDLAACAATCRAFLNCGVIEYGWKGADKKWCFIWSEQQNCATLEVGRGACGFGGSDGVHAYRFTTKEMRQAVPQPARLQELLPDESAALAEPQNAMATSQQDTAEMQVPSNDNHIQDQNHWLIKATKHEASSQATSQLTEADGATRMLPQNAPVTLEEQKRHLDIDTAKALEAEVIGWDDFGEGCYDGERNEKGGMLWLEQKVPSLKDCQALCLEFPNCGSVEWAEGPPSSCSMWSDAQRAILPAVKCGSGPKPSGSLVYKVKRRDPHWTYNEPLAQVIADEKYIDFQDYGSGCCLGKRDDRHGKLFEGRTATLSDCQSKCRKFSDCGAVEYGGGDKDWCFVWSSKQTCTDMAWGENDCGTGGNVGVHVWKYLKGGR